jgi:hypothetical protein
MYSFIFYLTDRGPSFARDPFHARVSLCIIQFESALAALRFLLATAALTMTEE